MTGFGNVKAVGKADHVKDHTGNERTFWRDRFTKECTLGRVRNTDVAEMSKSVTDTGCSYSAGISRDANRATVAGPPPMDNLRPIVS